MGYAFGQQPDPTYRRIGDHAEALQIDFDPSIISYRDLLHVFWHSHTPTREAWSRQYMSGIMTHNPQQQQLALETLAAESGRRGAAIHTEIVPFTRFYLAEDYHQKYALQHLPDVLAEFQQVYPTIAQLIQSTAAARVNGFASGYGTWMLLEAEIESYGLSQKAQQSLLSRVRAYTRR